MDYNVIVWIILLPHMSTRKKLGHETSHEDSFSHRMMINFGEFHPGKSGQVVAIKNKI